MKERKVNKLENVASDLKASPVMGLLQPAHREPRLAW